MVQYHCRRCHVIWYNNEHPIIRVPYMIGNIGSQRLFLYHRAQFEPRPRSAGSNLSPANLRRNLLACSGSAKQ